MLDVRTCKRDHAQGRSKECNNNEKGTASRKRPERCRSEGKKNNSRRGQQMTRTWTDRAVVLDGRTFSLPSTIYRVYLRIFLSCVTVLAGRRLRQGGERGSWSLAKPSS